MFKVNSKGTRTTPMMSPDATVNFEHISYLFVSIVDFERVNVNWGHI